jgi:hypothetical protein
MNERIRELAEQAGKLAAEHCNDTVDKFGIKLVFQDVFNEKFAALIVQECADVIRKEVSMKFEDGGETEEFMGGQYAGSVLARVKIEQHFGVEQ